MFQPPKYQTKFTDKNCKSVYEKSEKKADYKKCGQLFFCLEWVLNGKFVY